MDFNYDEVAYRMTEEVAIITFRKKDNSVRAMLCTADMRLMDKLIVRNDPGYVEMRYCGMAKRCSRQNGNIQVVDLIIEEPRCFNCGRLLEVAWLGKTTDATVIDAAVSITKEAQEKWNDLEALDIGEQAMYAGNIVKQIMDKRIREQSQ